MRGEWAGDHALQVQLDGQVSHREARVRPQSVGHGLQVGQGAKVGVDGQDERKDTFQQEETLLTLGQVRRPKQAEMIKMWRFNL